MARLTKPAFRRARMSSTTSSSSSAFDPVPPKPWTFPVKKAHHKVVDPGENATQQVPIAREPMSEDQTGTTSTEEQRNSIISIGSSSVNDTENTGIQTPIPVHESVELQGSDCYNSESDPSFVDQSSFIASTEDSSHSYDLLLVENREISEVIQDAAPQLLEVRLAEMKYAGRLRSSTMHEGKDLGASNVGEDSGLSMGASVRDGIHLQNDSGLGAPGGDADLTINSVHAGVIGESGLVTPPFASPAPPDMLESLVSDHQNESPAVGPSEFDPWNIVCDDLTVPLLSPDDTLRAIKRFLGVDQSTINFQSTLDLLTSLSRRPQWPALTIENLNRLVEIVHPGHRLLGPDTPREVRDEALAEMIPPGHTVVSPERMQRLLSFEMARPPSVLPKGNSDSGRGGETGDRNRRKREPKSEQWWRRFFNKDEDDLVLPPGIAIMLNRSAVENLRAVESPLIANPEPIPSTNSSPSKASRRRSKRVNTDAASAVDLVSSRILFMTTCSQSNVQNILLNVFFCMTSYHSDPSKWDKDYQALLEDDDEDEESENGSQGDRGALLQARPTYKAIEQKKLPRMMPRHYEKLWQDFQKRYPDFKMQRKEFEDMISAVRKRGSCYLYIAARLGLGSLLFLQADLVPEQMWGASKGGDKTGASERAFNRLEDLGLPRMCRVRGANRCVREMLLELMKGF